MKSPIYVGLLLGLLLAGCQAEAPPQETEAQEAEERTVLLAGRTLLLDGYHGSITIVGRTDSTATFSLEKTGRGESEEVAQTHLDGITVEASEGGDLYTLRLGSGQPEQTAVDVEARVPYKTPLRLDLESGSVTVEAVAAPIRAVVDNGAVEVKGAADDLDVEVGNGDLTVNMAGFREETAVRLVVDNGNIELALPASTSALVEAETQVGQIETSGLALQDREETSTTSGMRLRGQLGSGTGRIEVRTENGSITLHKEQ